MVVVGQNGCIWTRLLPYFPVYKSTFYNKNLLPKIVLNLYTDQKTNKKLHSLKLFENIWN